MSRAPLCRLAFIRPPLSPLPYTHLHPDLRSFFSVPTSRNPSPRSGDHLATCMFHLECTCQTSTKGGRHLALCSHQLPSQSLLGLRTDQGARGAESDREGATGKAEDCERGSAGRGKKIGLAARRAVERTSRGSIRGLWMGHRRRTLIGDATRRGSEGARHSIAVAAGIRLHSCQPQSGRQLPAAARAVRAT